jgi:hypothetical protein
LPAGRRASWRDRAVCSRSSSMGCYVSRMKATTKARISTRGKDHYHVLMTVYGLPLGPGPALSLLSYGINVQAWPPEPAATNIDQRRSMDLCGRPRNGANAQAERSRSHSASRKPEATRFSFETAVVTAAPQFSRRVPPGCRSAPPRSQPKRRRHQVPRCMCRSRREPTPQT